MTAPKDDAAQAPVVTVSGQTESHEEQGPLSVTANLPPVGFPPKSVGDLMTRKIITLGENEPVGELEEWMKRFRFRHLPVVNEGMKLVGLISQTDYLHAKLGFAPDGTKIAPVGATTPAGSIMRKKVVVAHMDHTLAMASEVMLSEKIGCLPVVLEDSTLVGIVTATDFLKLAHDFVKS